MSCEPIIIHEYQKINIGFVQYPLYSVQGFDFIGVMFAMHL